MSPNTDTVSQYPEVIIIQPGQSLQGRFLRLERGHTKDGDERAIAILEVDGAERAVWLHETALRAQFRQLKPKAGEIVHVEKGGEKREAASGFKYWPFKVTAPERPAEGLDWNDELLGGDDDAAAGVTQLSTSDRDPGPAPPSAGGDDDIPF